MNGYSKAPYRHADKSNCWTKNCSRNHVSNTSPKFIFPENDFNKNSQPVECYKSLEYGGEDYKSFVENAEGLVMQVTASEVQSLFEYTGSEYKSYYGFLEGTNRDGSKYGSQFPELERDNIMYKLDGGVRNLDSIIAKAGRFNKPTKVFRGETPPAGVNVMEHLLKNYPVGEVVNVKRFLSTSLEPLVASNTIGDKAGSYLLVITANEGAAIGDGLSEQGLREKEILLPRNKEYKVTKVSEVIVKAGFKDKKHIAVHLTQL